ncbi:methyltransferase [Nocardiopsis suaedae]|uniref:Methyltransferase n=1 Tax=Nocardiopsis suaedae TaxID=3018444 RepID=A0ABT4TRU5_9ACTN|nr:methyltransferase [Nocardiopsis suaedae]MDA2806862.1 methyltransferase [Nocardiopsis suaedae]
MTMPEDGLRSPHDIIAIATAFWRSKVLLSAVELGVFAELAKRPRNGGELCAALGVKGRGAGDFLDALVSMGVLEREDGVYRNAPVAAEYLDPAKPVTDISGYLSFLNAGFGWWSRLTEGLRSGDRLDFASALAASGGGDGGAAGDGVLRGADPGSDTFGEAFSTADQVTGFVRAMTGYSMGANRAIAGAFDWSGVRTVVDVGCSEGAFLAQVLGAHPHLSGTGFDLPEVGARFAEHLGQAGAAGRARFVGGDFFTDPLPAGDVIVMGHVLHDWDEEVKRMLVRKAHEALEPGGRLLVYESLIDDGRRTNTMGMLTSLNVSLVSVGGRGYTGAQCREWMADAGFGGITVRHLDGPEYMVVAVK